MNTIFVIRKPGPPDSRSNVDTSETGPSLPHAAVRENSSVQMLQSITKVVEESRIVSAPGSSTSVVSRPGPSNQDIHQNITTQTDISPEKILTIFLVGLMSVKVRLMMIILMLMIVWLLLKILFKMKEQKVLMDSMTVIVVLRIMTSLRMVMMRIMKRIEADKK